MTAEFVLDDVAATLRAGKVQVNELYKFHAWEVGTTRASTGVHPKASLEAGSLFFRVALSHLARRIAVEADSPAEAFTLVATGMEESLSRRIRESAESYHRFLLNQVQEAQGEERRRIARELHDRIGHGISVAHQQLALAEVHRASDPARAEVKIGVAQQAIQETMENLRQITSELHPQVPVRSLEKALLGFLEAVEDDVVSVGLDVNGDESWAEPRVLDEAFLIIREAARNALSHAGPSVILMRVDIAPHELSATVQDNGQGFDPTCARERGGVGLTSMRERAELLGGSVAISSAPGNGCLVELLIPLKRQPHEPDRG
ncbi:sensor histidine kinase [Nonomuraea aurantiaca]|jgi:signal transduction histidine kinase|uniref:sensor histidine kinase n=1 Tax=Nonomuraea aurantiaca TaxID=2878562 RepID=UPI001CDA1B36|nr:sensor histidine kinase [Nonomuraea aurantiaca]MCA2220957.1 sensor histidine kinase [Nonomuraea aurantiaca]